LTKIFYSVAHLQIILYQSAARYVANTKFHMAEADCSDIAIGPVCGTFSQSWVVRTVSNLQEHRPIIRAQQMFYLDFKHFATFSNKSDSKTIEVKNGGQIAVFLPPHKI